jgi:hypothetical protein
MIDGKGEFLDESKRGIPDFKTSLLQHPLVLDL